MDFNALKLDKPDSSEVIKLHTVMITKTRAVTYTHYTPSNYLAP